MKGICLKCGYVAKLAKDKKLINGKQLYKHICKQCDEEEKERTSWGAKRKLVRAAEVRSNAI